MSSEKDLVGPISISPLMQLLYSSLFSSLADLHSVYKSTNAGVLCLYGALGLT